MESRETFVKIKNNDHLVGRISTMQVGKTYSSEIDIIFEDSKKIFIHVGRLYGFEDEKEVVDSSIQKLSIFLRKQK